MYFAEIVCYNEPEKNKKTEKIMKKLKLAIIGQGRSGKDIHGKFYISDQNTRFEVCYVVDEDEFRRKVSAQRYPGAEILSDYRSLFGKDIDLVVNCTYSYLHEQITRDLLEHGFNVLVEKPFARTRFECDSLIRLAKERKLVLAVFQQTFYAPFYQDLLKVIEEKKIGDPLQVSIRYNNLSRRWDWQTLQKKLGGNAYNTGPHPFGMALGVLGFDKSSRIAFSKLGNTPMFSGDADDYCKAIITADGKPVVDVEINSTDAYTGYTVKIQGTRGTFRCTPSGYECKYILPGENPERKVVESFLANDKGDPVYCGEKLIFHEEQGKYEGTAFDVGTKLLYDDVYDAITEGKEMYVTAEKAAQIISLIETIHAQNPLEVRY